MKANAFNICPSCIHRNSCVLTDQKDKVWSCSEYEDTEVKEPTVFTIKNNNKNQPEMEMVKF